MILFVSTVYDRSSLIGILEQGQDPKRTTLRLDRDCADRIRPKLGQIDTEPDPDRTRPTLKQAQIGT